ncbi:stage II sporulation protein M [Sinanaerobacter chloroacetimidivorans]|jgi:stage II sporulation protein M|uniref:Stage II sporulation protein M n=1 Tax=Sinanaerobacter chloroacetimidivorans TaxID=2818044 RepID=A0A8J7VXH9_9FIRM|nr:stage II sporulation protein M [Sinanaerobacter chloroacetimidivorans]MBR0596862.1 stage II sporulation protein M [Sinanaerobacter chloroacetimidivorans]
MKRHTLNHTSNLVTGSSTSFAAALFFFMLGISAGVFTELLMNSTEKENMINYLGQYLLLSNYNDVSFSKIFFSSAGNNLILLLIMAVSGLTAIGFPIALAALTYKGMALGFSAALLIDSMSYKGVALIFTSMLPQNLILIPAILIAGIAALNVAFHTISNRRFGMKKSLVESSGSYTFINIILIVAVLAGSFIESFISPLLTQLIV